MVDTLSVNHEVRHKTEEKSRRMIAGSVDEDTVVCPWRMDGEKKTETFTAGELVKCVPPVGILLKSKDRKDL